MTSKIKYRLYEVLESSHPDDLLSRLDDWGVTLLVILDVSALVFETSKDISFPFNLVFDEIEFISLCCFTILYILQVWSCTADPRYSQPWRGRLRYALTPLMLIDLLAILPFYLILLLPDTILVEAGDIFRLLRLLKLIRYSESLQTILRVIGSKKDELFMTFVAVFILLIFASSVMYFAESDAQPEAFPSIPAAMWWGVVTLTTVGYGDIYPITPIGKLFGATLAFTGIGLFALPAGLIASGFSGELQKRTPKSMKFNHSEIVIPNNALSVKGVTAYLREVLETDPQLQNLWVIGEVSSVHQHRSGIFFTLTDTNGNAAINGVIWNSQRQQVLQLPAQGEQLFVYGNLRLYEKRGEYQLNVLQSLPAGEGLQALRYQQLKSRLEAEGLFEASRKRPLPSHPQTIAVVTSVTAAAWGDIQRTLSQRYPGLNLLFSPATVQGENAPESIAKAIARVEKEGRAEVLILARGGGSKEDLSCFNDERVVRAIALCSIPVVTGIGHQRDESLADLVADFSAHTPTAAAEHTVPEFRQLLGDHQQRVQCLASATDSRLRKEFEHLQRLQLSLKRLPNTARPIESAIAHTQLLQEKLTALNPRLVLSRGYAVVNKSDGKLVQTAEGIEVGEELVIQLQQGRAKVRVTQILPDF